MPPPLVAILTDFGERDVFVGVMKGVLLSRSPGAQVVDLTHAVAPGDIAAGAFLLWAAAPYFAAGSVFLGVVDPGVGGGGARSASPPGSTGSWGRTTGCCGRRRRD